MSDDAEVLGTKRRVVNFVVLCECLIKFSFSGRIAFIAQARSTATRVTIRYDTWCYFNVRSKAGMSQLNLPHGNDN